MNFHLTTYWKKNVIEPASSYFQGGGVLGAGLSTFRGLLSGDCFFWDLLAATNVLTYFQEGHYFWWGLLLSDVYSIMFYLQVHMA